MLATKRRFLTFLIIGIGIFALFVAPTFASTWPQRTVRLIVPLSAGIGVDLAARLFAERLSERWMQPVIVENRPGADGLIGVAAFAGMRDDHTLLFSFAAPLSVYPLLQEKLPYDPDKDIVPISAAADTIIALAASVDSGIDSLPSLVDRARSRPGKLNYNAGAGAFPYLYAGFLKTRGLDMVEVPYSQLSIAYQDLAQGRLDSVLTLMASMQALAQAGKIRLLAVTNKSRATVSPNVPTAIEAGYPELTFEGLEGFFGSRNISVELRDRIAADVREVAADPGIASRLASMAQTARGSTPTEFSTAIEEQKAKMASIMKLLGANPAH